MQYTHNELEPIFKLDYDYSYGSFEVAPTHYLCRVDGSFVFEISNIMLYNIVFKAEEFEDERQQKELDDLVEQKAKELLAQRENN